MALFRKFFHRKPPEGLLEISERVFVFDCCFTTDVLDIEDYSTYIGRIVDQLCQYLPEASIMVFNFEEGDQQSQIAKLLSKYNMTVIDYPRQYENFPLLTMETIQNFLRSSESWLSLGQRNLLLMHCQMDAFSVLAFVLAALLIYRKEYTEEKKTLDMIYKQAPQEILHLLTPLNPLPSQLRYLQYVSSRNTGSPWPPLGRAVTLKYIILRCIPKINGEGSWHPIFRIHGQDPFMAVDRTAKVLFSVDKTSKAVQHFMQADNGTVEVDIHCHVRGDIVLECITFDDNLKHEDMVFRVMFNTAFIGSNLLILNRDEIDILWHVKDQFPQDFRAEVLFSEMSSASSLVGLDLPGAEYENLPPEAFVEVQGVSDSPECLVPYKDYALNWLQQITDFNVLQENMEIAPSPSSVEKTKQIGLKQNGVDEQIENVFVQNYVDKRLGSISDEVYEEKLEGGFTQSVQKDKFSNVYPVDYKEIGPKESITMVVLETPKSEASEKKALISGQTSVNETNSTFLKSSLDKSLTTKKIESSEQQVFVRRPVQCKVVSQRISPTLVSNLTLYSNSFQCSSIAISRYHGAPSALGITALLHDHAGFNDNKDAYSHKPIAPEQSTIGNPETREDSTSLPPPPPPPPPLFRSTNSVNLPPSLPWSSVPRSPCPPLEVPPAPPPSLSSPSAPTTCQKYPSKLSGIQSTRHASSLLLQERLEYLPSGPSASIPTPPPPPPAFQSKSFLSVPVLPSIEFCLDSKMSSHVGPRLPVPHPPPPPPPSTAFATSLSSDEKSFSSVVAPPSCCSQMDFTFFIDPSHVSFPTNLPLPSAKESNSFFGNASCAPRQPSSVKKALPSLQSTTSASTSPPPPHPPFLGKAKGPSLLSVPLPPPLPPSSAATVCHSPGILPPVALPPFPILETASFSSITDLSLASLVPSPPFSSSNEPTVHNPSTNIPPPTAPLPGKSCSTSRQDSFLVSKKLTLLPTTLPTAPPPPCSGMRTISARRATPSPPPPSCGQKEASVRCFQRVPPPPAPLPNGLAKAGTTSLQSHFSVGGGGSTLTVDAKGKLQLRASARVQAHVKKTSLKPYHWLKLTRVMQGSLWAEAQKPEEASKAPELDMFELESLFSATVPNSSLGDAGGKTNGRASCLKSEKVHLIELRRAYNCEIMLTKVKVPLSDLLNSILYLDDSSLDIDQVDNLIKFCPTKEEIELLKNYSGNQENLGKCEQFFLELMKVPRVESKLRVFSFKIQFCSQISELRSGLNIVNSTSREVRNSVKLKRIMQTVLSLGNALNHGTARGSAIGFRLDSLLKLTETRSRNKKLTLMHYLCKVLAEKLPEVIDFHKDLASLEAATKIQLKYLAEEMQAIGRGLEKVAQELTASENDGLVSENFCKTLKGFLEVAEAEVRSLASLYSEVGKNADALAFYFGEDPVRCPFEQVVSTLLNFVRMFLRAHEENFKQLEYEKKKALKEAEYDKAKSNAPFQNRV